MNNRFTAFIRYSSYYSNRILQLTHLQPAGGGWTVTASGLGGGGRKRGCNKTSEKSAFGSLYSQSHCRYPQSPFTEGGKVFYIINVLRKYERKNPCIQLTTDSLVWSTSVINMQVLCIQSKAKRSTFSGTAQITPYIPMIEVNQSLFGMFLSHVIRLGRIRATLWMKELWSNQPNFTNDQTDRRWKRINNYPVNVHKQRQPGVLVNGKFRWFSSMWVKLFKLNNTRYLLQKCSQQEDNLSG